MSKKNKYGTLSNIWFLAKNYAENYPLLVVYIILQMILAVVSPVFGIYVPKLTLDLVTDGASVQRVLTVLGGFGLVMALSMAVSGMAGRGKYMMYNSIRLILTDKLYYQSLSCDYDLIESAEGQTKYSRACQSISRGDWSGTSELTVAAIDIFVAVACFIIYSGIISVMNPLILLVLILLSCVNFFFTKRAQNYEESQMDETSRLSKKINYMENTADDWKYGKDIRLYTMRGFLLALARKLSESYADVCRKIQKRYFSAGIINAFTLFLRDSLSYGYLIWAVYNDTISIADFVLYFGAVTGFSDFIGRIVEDINEINGANIKMNDLRAFLDNTDAPEPDDPLPIPCGDDLSIEFKNICFSYSPDSEPVLKDFNLFISAGEKISIVGVNGAGKTTLIKLLCGFYTPDSGVILINGINADRFRKSERFKLFSAVFQDIFILPVTVAENVSLQKAEDTDMERVKRCLEIAGLYDAISQYPDGLNSFMLKEVHDGIVLSGGQQQKLLIARCLYKNAPILIFDEPTSALDPIAESETYESFHSISGNKTSIYISHRLASTRFCDRVVLLSRGQAKEVGSHDELINLGGEYAKMFEIQSHYYKEEVSENA